MKIGGVLHLQIHIIGNRVKISDRPAAVNEEPLQYVTGKPGRRTSAMIQSRKTCHFHVPKLHRILKGAL